MTVQQLNDYHNLVKQIACKEEQIKNLRQNIGTKSPNMDGMPHGTGVSDRTANISIEITDLEQRLEFQKQKADKLRPDIECFINQINDDITRLVFRFRVMYGYSWQEVADTLGGYNTKGSVRERYFSYADKMIDVA